MSRTICEVEGNCMYVVVIVNKLVSKDTILTCARKLEWNGTVRMSWNQQLPTTMRCLIGAKNDGHGDDNWTIRRIQSSCQIVTTNKTNTELFTVRMPFVSLNQQCQSREGKITTFHGLAPPSSAHLGSLLSILLLATKGRKQSQCAQ